MIGPLTQKDIHKMSLCDDDCIERMQDIECSHTVEMISVSRVREVIQLLKKCAKEKNHEVQNRPANKVSGGYQKGFAYATANFQHFIDECFQIQEEKAKGWD